MTATAVRPRRGWPSAVVAVDQGDPRGDDVEP